MPRRQIFYSFHYEKDVFRVQQIRNIGMLEDNKPVSVNEWETIKRGGTESIQRWIDENMKYKNCLVALIGEDTYDRPWVRYEIKKAWNDGKGVLGIYIHNLKCPRLTKEKPLSSGKSNQGKNPFSSFSVDGYNMSSIVPCYNPDDGDAYNSIKMNLENWVENAIQVRSHYK